MYICIRQLNRRAGFKNGASLTYIQINIKQKYNDFAVTCSHDSKISKLIERCIKLLRQFFSNTLHDMSSNFILMIAWFEKVREVLQIYFQFDLDSTFLNRNKVLSHINEEHLGKFVFNLLSLIRKHDWFPHDTLQIVLWDRV